MAFFSAIFSVSGVVAQVGSLTLAAAWLYSAVRAYLAIRARQIQLHRIWVIRNYALTFAAVVLRVILGVGMLLPVSFSELYPSRCGAVGRSRSWSPSGSSCSGR